MIPFIGFAPDADPTTPGVITDCVQLIPYESGMKAAPSVQVPNGVGPLAGECRGANVLANLAGTRRVLAGTPTKLYALNGTAWTDVSRVAAYTLGSDSRWSFAQFGDAALAANGTDLMQRSVGGAFADIAGSPRAEIVISVRGFAIAFNFNDGTVTPDGWICSAMFDDTSWAQSVATQATKGRLVSTEGRITAGMRLGSYAVAYKEKAIYLGQYVNAPVVWEWDQIVGGDAGASGKDAVVDVGGVHIFVNDEGFWSFDGTRPAPLPNSPRKWWLSKSDPVYRYRTLAAHDKQNNLVWFYYCSNGSGGVRDSAVVYHLLTKQWGRANRNIEAAFGFISPGVTIDGLNAYAATINDLPNIGVDSQFWLGGGRSMAIVDSAHQVQQMTGPAENSSLTTGDFGDDDQVTILKKVRPRFAKTPATAVAGFFSRMVGGGALATGQTAPLNDGQFYSVQRGRWHRARMDFTGDVSITGFQPELAPNGRR